MTLIGMRKLHCKVSKVSKVSKNLDKKLRMSKLSKGQQTNRTHDQARMTHHHPSRVQNAMSKMDNPQLQGKSP